MLVPSDALRHSRTSGGASSNPWRMRTMPSFARATSSFEIKPFSSANRKHVSRFAGSLQYASPPPPAPPPTPAPPPLFPPEPKTPPAVWGVLCLPPPPPGPLHPPGAPPFFLRGGKGGGGVLQ